MGACATFDRMHAGCVDEQQGVSHGGESIGPGEVAHVPFVSMVTSRGTLSFCKRTFGFLATVQLIAVEGKWKAVGKIAGAQRNLKHYPTRLATLFGINLSEVIANADIQVLKPVAGQKIHMKNAR